MHTAGLSHEGHEQVSGPSVVLCRKVIMDIYDLSALESLRHWDSEIC